MKIYLDYILIENIIVNFIIIYQVNIFTKSKINLKRIIFASVILSFYTVVIYLLNNSYLNNFLIKILIINISLYICFKPKSISEYLKKFLYYYILNYIYIGVIIGITLLFKISIDSTAKKICVYILSGIITYLFNNYLWKLWKTNIKNNTLVYTLKIKNQEINCFVDTGNLVHNNLYNLDVIFLDYRWYGILELLDVLNNKVDLTINTINDNNNCYGYIVKDVEIYKNNKYICKLSKIIFSFSNQKINIDNKCTGIIGYNLYIEKLGGVKL